MQSSLCVGNQSGQSGQNTLLAFVELISGFMLFKQKHCDSTIFTCWAPNCTNNMIQHCAEGKWRHWHSDDSHFISCVYVIVHVQRAVGPQWTVVLLLSPSPALWFDWTPVQLILLLFLQVYSNKAAAVVLYLFLSASSPAAGVTPHLSDLSLLSNHTQEKDVMRLGDICLWGWMGWHLAGMCSREVLCSAVVLLDRDNPAVSEDDNPLKRHSFTLL